MSIWTIADYDAVVRALSDGADAPLAEVVAAVTCDAEAYFVAHPWAAAEQRLDRWGREAVDRFYAAYLPYRRLAAASGTRAGFELCAAIGVQVAARWLVRHGMEPRAALAAAATRAFEDTALARQAIHILPASCGQPETAEVAAA